MKDQEVTEITTPEQKQAALQLPASFKFPTFFDVTKGIQLPAPFSYEVDAQGVVVLKYAFTGVTLGCKFIEHQVIAVEGKAVLVAAVEVVEPYLIDAIESIYKNIKDAEDKKNEEAVKVEEAKQEEAPVEKVAAPKEKAKKKKEKTKK